MLPDQIRTGPFRYFSGRPMASSRPPARTMKAATIAKSEAVPGLRTNRLASSAATTAAKTIRGGTNPSSINASLASPRLPDLRHQLLLQSGRARIEDPLRILGVADHVGVDRVGAIQVQAAAGEILQAQVAIAVDLRVFQPGTEIRRLSRKRREKIERRVHADLGQGFLNRRELGLLQARFHLVEIDRRPVRLAEQHQIVAGAV